MLLIEHFPFVAQFPDLGGKLRRIPGFHQQRLGALAQLLASALLAERFPALELRELLHQAGKPFCGGIRRFSGAGHERLDLLGGRSRGVDLPRSQRLLGQNQQASRRCQRAVTSSLAVLARSILRCSIVIIAASKRRVRAGVRIARFNACQRSSSAATSTEVPAASCSASTTSSSPPAIAWHSCSRFAMRSSA